MKRLLALFILFSFLVIQIHGVFHDSMEHQEGEGCEICLLLSTPTEPSVPRVEIVQINLNFAEKVLFQQTEIIIDDLFLQNLESRGPPKA